MGIWGKIKKKVYLCKVIMCLLTIVKIRFLEKEGKDLQTLLYMFAWKDEVRKEKERKGWKIYDVIL